MTSRYRIGDLVVYKVEYKDPKGVVRGKPRPLVIISEPNSKGDYLAIAGSTKIHQWFDEEHVLITSDIVLGGSLDKPTIFPASKQILIDSKFVRAQIGRIPVEYLDTLLRQCFSQYTKAFFQGVHAPKIESPFTPGESRIPYAGRVYDDKEMINLVDSALDFWLTAGPYAREFEKKMCSFFKAKKFYLVNSGSSANLVMMSALRSSQFGSQLKAGDEVITPSVTFATTVTPIVQNQLIPVFVDCEIGTYNIDPNQIEDAVSSKTKAIFVPHTLGNPCNMDVIMDIAKRKDLIVLEDSCDALGATYGGKLVGTFGSMASLSFYPAHHMTMGEGGGVIINDPQFTKIALSIRDWGRDCWCEPGHNNTCGQRFSGQFGDLPFGYDHKYVYSNLGYNLKVTDMQAAIGLAQLEKLEQFVETRRNNFNYYYEHLKAFEDKLILPRWEKKSNPSWFGFPITVRDGVDINRLIKHLEGAKIETRKIFAGNILKQPGFKKIKHRVHRDLKITDIIMEKTFFIGVYPGLTEEMREFVVFCFEKFFKEKAYQVVDRELC